MGRKTAAKNKEEMWFCVFLALYAIHVDASTDHQNKNLGDLLSEIKLQQSISRVAQDVLTEHDNSSPLCLHSQDDSHLNCSLQKGSFAPQETPLFKDKLMVVSYNIDWNGQGGDGADEAGLEPMLFPLVLIN
eukprot:TRINITY_DN1876_c0_g1_i4.p2 TRINITY_DN1876_c0_g1~~TRINITY_DN1876_c0_g1_i4.p2  ORF type:complete len:132 (-),score=20.79 TRINITY_DN1876_c0_g1_i4:911-1306(-)